MALELLFTTYDEIILPIDASPATVEARTIDAAFTHTRSFFAPESRNAAINPRDAAQAKPPTATI